VLINNWGCDIRGLSYKDVDNEIVLEYEVPDDGEGRIKNVYSLWIFASDNMIDDSNYIYL